MEQVKRAFTFIIWACLWMLASAALLARFSPEHNAIIVPVVVVPACTLLVIGLFGGRPRKR